MARKTNGSGIDEGSLTKGELRKLIALRKSLGQDIADKAFAEWMATQPTETGSEDDRNAEVIASVLWDQIQGGELAIPRGGYLVRRGRGRVVVKRAASD